MSKTLPEIFSKYHPDEQDLRLLLSASPESVRLRCDRDQRIMEIGVDFPAPEKPMIPKISPFSI